MFAVVLPDVVANVIHNWTAHGCKKKKKKDCYGDDQPLSDWIWSFLHKKKFIPDTVNLVEIPWLGRS